MNPFASFAPLAHNLFRIVFGFAFFTHGAQKLFGWFTTRDPVTLMSEFGVAGVIECFGGLLIMIGLGTSWAAFIASGEMAVAYFWKHGMTDDGFRFWFWDNRGELVALYCFAFLFLATIGAGTWSVDAKLAQRRL